MTICTYVPCISERVHVVGHLTYVGDADLGEDINVGGTFVNYDGKINTVRQSVATYLPDVMPIPLRQLGVGDDVSRIAAGSTITEDVPAGAFAIARSRQVTKKITRQNTICSKRLNFSKKFLAKYSKFKQTRYVIVLYK